MNETNEEKPRGILLVAQAAYLQPTHEEMVRALPPRYRDVPHVLVDLDVPGDALQTALSGDFGPARRALEGQMEERLSPQLKRYPDYPVVYFGSAPIPLTVWLGARLDTWHHVDVVPHHHARREWGWVTEPGQAPARLAVIEMPDYRDRSVGEAVIRVSTSHRVDKQVTALSVPDALVEIDIALEHPSEDAFTRVEEMQAVAQSFRRALDLLGDSFPNVGRVHLFASVQPGMALLLGAQVSRTMHPPVWTYQYERRGEEGPRHTRALLINAPETPPLPDLSEEEIARAAVDRKGLQSDLGRMKGFAQRLERKPGSSWLADTLADEEAEATFHRSWRELPRIYETPLLGTRCDIDVRSVGDSFRLTDADAWEIDDHWLARLAKRIPDKEERARALRQLVLHEAIHRGPQALTRSTSVEIGRFPRVLEEVDYHADVWAMLHELALTESQGGVDLDRSADFFSRLILLGTETMWAFDDGPPLADIQIRRLNRYLIWYWQYLQLERAMKDPKMKLPDVVSLLADKPILELAGPPIVTRDQRVHFDLDPKRSRVPELAIYHQGKLFRHGERLDFSIASLLHAVRNRDGQSIIAALRPTFEQVVRP